MDPLPSISVIIPAYNSERTIRSLMDSLQSVTYPRELLEILVVDNGSTDGTKEIIRAYPVTLLEEREVRSSYAARNRALREARNEILAFTDADCIATPDWLREGVRAMEGADLVAGNVDFIFSPRPTLAELFDSLHHMQNDDLIRKYSGAATANLFVKASLFRQLGPFRSDVRSGGDMMWTRAATGAGFKLVYAPSAVVQHPTRRLGQLLIKGLRLGTGTYRMHREKGVGTGQILYEGLRSLIPRRVGPTREIVRDRGGPECSGRLWGIWWVGYLYGAARGMGLLYALCGLPVTRREGSVAEGPIRM